MEEFRNNKNQEVYIVWFEAIDKTNFRDGEIVYIYYKDGEAEFPFVRNKSEFLSKFTKI